MIILIYSLALWEAFADDPNQKRSRRKQIIFQNFRVLEGKQPSTVSSLLLRSTGNPNTVNFNGFPFLSLFLPELEKEELWAQEESSSSSSVVLRDRRARSLLPTTKHCEYHLCSSEKKLFKFINIFIIYAKASVALSYTVTHPSNSHCPIVVPSLSHVICFSL